MDSLYYEIHVTIEWTDKVAENIPQLKEAAGLRGFHMGDLLLMKKDEERSHKDVFFTARATTLIEAIQKTQWLCMLFKNHYNVLRYKIEDTVIDSRINDVYNLVELVDA